MTNLCPAPPRACREEEKQRADAIKGVCDLLAKEVGEREEDVKHLEAMLNGEKVTPKLVFTGRSAPTTRACKVVGMRGYWIVGMQGCDRARSLACIGLVTQSGLGLATGCLFLKHGKVQNSNKYLRAQTLVPLSWLRYRII